MLGWLIGLGLASAAAATAGSALNYSSQKRQQDLNYDLQKESLQLQKEQFAYQKDYDAWQQKLAESNFQLQSSPISSLVKDGSTVGVNPMAALGQNIGSASVPSSNANTSFGAGSVPLMDTGLSSMLSMMSNIITTGMNVKAETDIAKQNQALKAQELSIIEENNQANIGLGSERNRIAAVEAEIHKQLANANDTKTASEVAHLAHLELLDYKRIALEQARLDYEKELGFKKFGLAVSEFEKRYQYLDEQLKQAERISDKNRRMQYITRISGQIFGLVGSIFGHGGMNQLFMDNFDREIGFKPNR